MAFTSIDPTTPAGTDKKKFGDDKIREFKEQVISNLQEVTNYPASSKPALRTAVWTTDTRPTGDELVDRITGYNTDLGCEEYYDLASTSWKTIARQILSQWTVSSRPSNPYVGQYGYCSDLNVVECWSGSAWIRISGGRRGDIKMWSGAVNNIETGWVLCDGVQRTHPEGGNFTPPDLRNRFIVGAGNSYAVGATGGEETHTLTVNEMPSHNHTIEYRTTSMDGDFGLSCGNHYNTNYAITSSVGGGQPHENRPPYYALCFLYKL